MKTILHFQLPDGLDADDASRISVEVTDEKLNPFAATQLTETLALDEGIYGATAQLPDGRKISGAVKIDSGAQLAVMKLKLPATASSWVSGALAPGSTAEVDDHKAAADPASGGVRPAASEQQVTEQRVLTYRQAMLGQSIPRYRLESTAMLECKLVLMRGSPWTKPEFDLPAAWQNATVDVDARGNRPFISLPVQGAQAMQAVQFIRPGRRPITVALPIEPTSCGDVQLRRGSDGSPFPYINFRDRDIDLLLRYAGAGLLGEALKVAERASVVARELIGEKHEHPIGAALGFYLLLRLGDERIDPTWTERLVRIAPWLPDALSIHAELLSRRGQHQEAVQYLMKLPECGLPLFASGLSYAADRLKRYQGYVSNGHMKAVPGLPRVLKALTQVAALADPTRPILTYKSGGKISRKRFEEAPGKMITVLFVRRVHDGETRTENMFEHIVDGADLPASQSSVHSPSEALTFSVDGLSKEQFLKINQAKLEGLIEAVNTELYTVHATDCKIVTREDLWVLVMCEAGLKQGHVDPDHKHSEGERGLLPLPENIKDWNGSTAPAWNEPMLLGTNLWHFTLYLGQLKNKGMSNANGMRMYRDLFRQPGIAGNPAREAKVLAGVVHGYFYHATYSDNLAPYAYLIRSYQTDVPLTEMMAGTAYRHAGTRVLKGRQDNIENALMLLA